MMGKHDKISDCGLALSGQSAAGAGLGGLYRQFVNPVTDICWDCIFPLSIGGTVIASGTARPT